MEGVAADRRPCGQLLLATSRALQYEILASEGKMPMLGELSNRDLEAPAVVLPVLSERIRDAGLHVEPLPETYAGLEPPNILGSKTSRRISRCPSLGLPTPGLPHTTCLATHWSLVRVGV